MRLSSNSADRLLRTMLLAALVMGSAGAAAAQPSNGEWSQPTAIAPMIGVGIERLPGEATPYENEVLPPSADLAATDAMDVGPQRYHAPAFGPGSHSTDTFGVAPYNFDRYGVPYTYHYGGKARGYYTNDQRIEFTGQEATFGVEGVLDGGLHQQVGAWDCGVEGEFFLNQPFDRNLLLDSPSRVAFAPNFDIEPFQISQLYVSARKDDLYFALGRFVTPFGRFYFSNYFNNFSDSPFIRSEAILFRETGVLAQWDPGPFVFTAALTNGGPEKDTNSSKAIIARVGVDQQWYAFGASVKQQDGIGSEYQKTYNQHYGADAMVTLGRWTLSGEAIHDDYGLRKPLLSPNQITWGRSIYYRDYNKSFLKPFQGIGYYIDLGYRGDRWESHLNYGDYSPQDTLGIAAHDTAIQRGLFKLSYHHTPHWETYGILSVENQVPLDFDGRIRYGTAYTMGVQFSL